LQLSADARALVARFRAVYADEYASITALGAEAIARWTPIVAAARLCEQVAGEESLLLALAGEPVVPPRP
jgi:hypothetical protein